MKPRLQAPARNAHSQWKKKKNIIFHVLKPFGSNFFRLWYVVPCSNKLSRPVCNGQCVILRSRATAAGAFSPNHEGLQCSGRSGQEPEKRFAVYSRFTGKD